MAHVADMVYPDVFTELDMPLRIVTSVDRLAERQVLHKGSCILWICRHLETERLRFWIDTGEY